MKNIIFYLLLMLPVIANSQIVSFETIIVIDGQETPILRQSSNRDNLIEFLKSAIESAEITPSELGIEVGTGDCPYVDVIGGNFNSAGAVTPYPNGNSPVYLSRSHVFFYNNTALPATDVWVALPDNLDPKRYIFKIVAIQK